MSDPKSALPGARAEGFAKLEEAGLQGMITLRGDFSDKKFTKAVEKAAGCRMPETRHISQGDGTALAWMSPDELLLMVPHDRAAQVTDDLSAALDGVHHLALNVSDMRAMFRVTGGDAVREVLAKVSPVDFSADAFGVGDFRRTRMAQVPAAIWMPEEGTLCVICFRSVAQYAFDLLKTASEKGGEVGFYARA